MKKQVLVAIIALVPTMGFAKVTDFNALISENVQTQKELHSTVKHNVQEAKEATEQENGKREKIVVVDNSRETYNAPTKKDLLVFEKERTFHRISDEKQLDRLATELSNQGE